MTNITQMKTQVKKGFLWLKEYTKRTVQDIKQSKVKYLLLLSFVAYLFTAITLPLTHDEALTYIFYLKCSVLDTMMYYTMPNNHILFSLIEHVFIILPGDLLFKMRLPVVLISMLTLISTYRFAKKYYTENVALVVVAIVSMSGMILFYSVLARGYCLVILFFAICLYAGFNIVNNNRRRDWIVFALSGALGLYAVPSFLYAFASVNLYILWYNYRHIKLQVGYNLLMLLFFGIFYFPVMLGSGWRSLFKNSNVAPGDRADVLNALPAFLSDTVESLFALPLYFVLPVLLLLIIICLLNKDKRTLSLWLIFCLTPPLFVVMHAAIPFPRTFVYSAYAIAFLSVISVRQYLVKMPMKWLFPILIIAQGLLFINFQNKTTLYLRPLATFEALTDHVLKEKNASAYIATANWQNSGFFFSLPNIRFEAERRGVADRLGYKDALAASADTIDSYDFIYIESHLDETRIKKLIEVYYPDSIENLFHQSPIHIYRGKE